jgi:methylation protein EvaC
MENNAHKCRVCDNKISITVDFGSMPIANNLLNPNNYDIKNEYKFRMQTAVCNKCSCFQVVSVPDKNLMFNNSYTYFASQSNSMKLHFNKLGDSIIKNFIKDKTDYILDIGSNDGIFLKNFADKGIDHLGVDASENVVNESKLNGVDAICGFFNKELCKSIIEKRGKAKVIISTNTMHHIEKCHEVLEGMDLLLKDDGVIIIEDPYLPDMLNLGSFEQIYAEHNFIWCCKSYKTLFEKYSFYLNKVEHFSIHGGSMRYFFTRNNIQEDSAKKYLELEKKLKISDDSIYLNFKNKSENVCNNLKKFLIEKKREGKSICGYGATAKSATLLNFADIDTSLIDCIYDSTPAKIGKLTPGTHIPIKDASTFHSQKFDYTIIFAWNLMGEIINKEKNNGAKTIWVEYVPEIKLTNAN